MHSTLISAADLHRNLRDFVVVDCRFDLANPSSGRNAFAAGHIPGAVYAHLDSDLSSPITPQSGRHPLPQIDKLAQRLGEWGIDNLSQVVAYDADSGMFASRLWWLLRWLGHSSVAVLNGGYRAWAAAGFSSETAVAAPAKKTFLPRPNNALLASADEVKDKVQRTDWRVLDARAPERFRGDIEPIDPVAGHIPGARNHPFAWNMGSDGCFLPPEESRAKLVQSLDGVASERTIAMCGSGVTACHNLLAFELAGLSGAKLYAGSWSEWIRDPSRPVAKG